MDVKIDTKEKFTVITPIPSYISANMTDELAKMMLSYQKKSIPHLILNLKQVNKLDASIAEQIAFLQQQFYEQDASFIVCEVQKEVEILLKEKYLYDAMNITPTESEAWDMLQMEEVERELLKDFDNEPDI